MELHLPKTENWFVLNQKVHSQLNLPTDLGVRVYRGLHHACFEIAQGTATFLAHKKSVAWRKGQSYSYSTVLPYLYKEGFVVQPLAQKDPNIELKAWVESLKKDTSFGMMNDDNPVTGQLFVEENDVLDELFNEKKIFSFRASHVQHWMTVLPQIRPYSVHLLEVNEDVAIALMGSKFKSPVQITAHFDFDHDYVLMALRSQTASGKENPQLISQFLEKLPAGFLTFPCGAKSLQDRAMIYHPEINGQALAAALGMNEHVIPLTACAQGFTDWEWWEGRPSFEQLRGLVILDLHAVQELTDGQRLKDAMSRCQI